MIRKIVTVLVLIPLGIALVMLAVGNRAPVAISLDPLAGTPPMFSASAPLFLVLLVALIAGVIVGGVAAWSRQRKWRRRARRASAELKAVQAENAILRRRLEAMPPAQPPQQTSIASIAYRHSNAA